MAARLFIWGMKLIYLLNNMKIEYLIASTVVGSQLNLINSLQSICSPFLSLISKIMAIAMCLKNMADHP